MSENEAKFVEFKIEEGKIDFVCNDIKNGQERTIELYFHFDKPITPCNDAIAAAVSTMIRLLYKKVYIDLDISSRVLEIMKKFNRAEITCKTVMEDKPATVRNGYSLNFSGGFDSLAAMYLVPDAKLVSVDFVGRYGREREFFSLFDTNIVSTNARNYGFVGYYGFCGVGSILYADALGIKIQYSGNILEEGPQWLREGGIKPRTTIGVSTSYDIRHINLTTGLTEVGTTIIACHYAPEHISKSLFSLANQRSEKIYRKKMLVQIASEILNKKIEIDGEILPPRILSEWNNYFATDFLSIYFLKKLGRDAIRQYLINIPDEIAALTDKLSLSFYEKFNTNYLEQIPIDIRGTFLARMSQAGIMPYNEIDWKEFRIVADCLAKYYPKINVA